MKAESYRLRNKVTAAFIALALMIAALFSFFNLLFVYSTEDTFFYHLLLEEEAHQQTALLQQQKTTQPLRPYVSLYHDISQLPAEIHNKLLTEPERQEFSAADGKHYHLHWFSSPAGTRYYLLAEVSQQLVVRPMREQMLIFYAALTLLMLIVAVSMAYWLARRTLSPLSQLVTLVQQATPGKLPQQFAAGFADDEVGMLAKALQQNYRRLAEVIEREQHFTRDASHELRTPVSIIRGAAELLGKQDLPALAQQQLQRIVQANTQMEQSISLLLSLAREELTPPSAAILLLPVLESVIVQQNYLLQGKDIQLDIDIAADSRVIVPQAVLQLLLSNLLSNTFSHSQAGNITLHYQHNCLSISDNGCGIATELQQRLFQPLAKGEHSQGYGLGLSIVQRVCQRYHIGLTLNSNNAGTTVYLNFPH